MLAILLIAAVSLILTVVLIGLVAALFDHRAFACDVQILHANSCRGSAHALPITAANLANLPDPVQLYLATVGVIGRPRIHGATVFHGGSFCTQPGGRWVQPGCAPNWR